MKQIATKHEKVQAIVLGSNALINLIESVGDVKPFAFPHVKTLAGKLVRAIEVNSNILFNKNQSTETTQFAVEFVNLAEQLIITATIINWQLDSEERRAFGKEYMELLEKFKIDPTI